jgi:hypothetical protein
MVLELGYDCGMQRMAKFALALVVFFIAGCGVPGVHAQANWGPSVTSMGFGGSNRPGGIPPSVTSLGFGQTGFAHTGTPGWGGNTHFHNPMFPGTPIGNPGHHRPYYPYYPAWGGYYAYPVFIDSGDAYQQNYDSVDNADNPDEYRGGPTIFDRRGDGQYVPSSSTRRSELDHESLAAVPPPPPGPAPEVADQPETVLVFKDGHQASVDNYAIVGSTLYDLSGGKRHKIPLADLDLNATAQRNDDRGVDFEVPTSSPAN